MIKDDIQKQALSCIMNNPSKASTIVMSTGTGKSKVAIDYLKESKSKNILITSPRTNLKGSWRDELEKWGIFRNSVENPASYIYKKIRCFITIENIQTCYKWNKEQLEGFDLIIADEIHTMATPKFSNLFQIAKELDITVVGLTGTPDDRKRDKALFYQQYCPIVYRYLDSAKDGIVNKRKYIVFEYELDDTFQIEVKTKFKSWWAGEKKQYNYAQSQINKGERLIRDILEVDDGEYVNYFGYAQSWYFNKTTSKEKKNAGGTYMRGINARQEVLWNLNSTSILAKRMSTIIQETYEESKVLVFSSRTEQANKISPCSVHSKNEMDDNEMYLSQFNQGNIRELGSCYSLTLGLNLKNAGFAIMESYNSSDVQFKQRAGRTDRLPVDEDAIVIFIVVKNTQGEKWFNNSINFDDDDEVRIVKSLKEFKEMLLELKPVK